MIKKTKRIERDTDKVFFSYEKYIWRYIMISTQDSFSWMTKLSGTDLMLISYFVMNSTSDNLIPYLSIRNTIKTKTGLSLGSIKNIVSKLIKLNFLKRYDSHNLIVNPEYFYSGEIKYNKEEVAKYNLLENYKAKLTQHDHS